MSKFNSILKALFDAKELIRYYRRNLVGSLPRGMPTVVDESVEVRVRELDGDTERKRQ